LNSLSGYLRTKIPRVWYATTIIYLANVDLYNLCHIEDFFEDAYNISNIKDGKAIVGIKIVGRIVDSHVSK